MAKSKNKSKKTTNQRRKAIKRPIRSVREWIGGRVAFPVHLIDGDEPACPEVILWLESPGDLIVFHELVEHGEQCVSFDGQPVSFGNTLLAAMESPIIGRPRRPTRIRVADVVLAEEIREVAPDIEIKIAPTPELNAVIDFFMEQAGDGIDVENQQSHFQNGRISEPSVDQLFHTARRLYLAAPWKKIRSDRQVLLLDVPALEVENFCVSIIGIAGERMGLVLYPSVAGFSRFLDFLAENADGFDLDSVDMGTSMLTLNFHRATDLPQSLRHEAAKHGWPVADTNAYPLVTHYQPDRIPKPPTEREVRIVSVCAAALTDFFDKHAELLRAGYPADPFTASFTTEDGIEARLTFPDKASLPADMVDETLDDSLTHPLGEDTSEDLSDKMFSDTLPREEQSRIVLQFKDNHYSAWPDQPLPALNGETPRKAVKTNMGRRQVTLLLKDFEKTEAQQPESARYDFSGLRAELGIEDDPASRE
uniref:Antitoxin Xre/MbcA/ParS-like toxin-binding domain-containing protein n=1 Tax=Candidatus Kentrum sp. DK TaxID=2126562 RepID=A0A450T1D9_9GAMM|nr:MAG: hypothetical protein BECKDK2373B_GA0170837_10912 [Candidatus Kentron sp. DK]